MMRFPFGRAILFLLLLALVGGITGASAQFLRDRDWHRKAIEVSNGKYNEQTGSFEWIDHSPKPEQPAEPNRAEEAIKEAKSAPAS